MADTPGFYAPFINDLLNTFTQTYLIKNGGRERQGAGHQPTPIRVFINSFT